jgi:signal peptidase I
MSEEKKDIETKDIIKDYVITFIYAFVVFLIVRAFTFELFIIPSGSMKPMLIEGDIIAVSKYEYGYSRYSLPLGINLIKDRIFDYHKPERGDVIVFKLPSNPKIFYIKRLIGLPNDRVQMRNGDLYINNKLISKEYKNDYTDEKYNLLLSRYEETLEDVSKKYDILREKNFISEANNTKEFIIPDGYYFFMGDNRDNSLDSRFEATGFVPYNHIVGEAKMILFSKKQSVILSLLQFKNPFRFDRFFNKIN